MSTWWFKGLKCKFWKSNDLILESIFHRKSVVSRFENDWRVNFKSRRKLNLLCLIKGLLLLSTGINYTSKFKPLHAPQNSAFYCTWNFFPLLPYLQTFFFEMGSSDLCINVKISAYFSECFLWMVFLLRFQFLRIFLMASCEWYLH